MRKSKKMLHLASFHLSLHEVSIDAKKPLETFIQAPGHIPPLFAYIAEPVGPCCTGEGPR
jgi:hypothetical protein